MKRVPSRLLVLLAVLGLQTAAGAQPNPTPVAKSPHGLVGGIPHVGGKPQGALGEEIFLPGVWDGWNCSDPGPLGCAVCKSSRVISLK
jgi:hypothetical protein